MPITKSQEKKQRKGTIIMGMAASQARFLGLTARKTNIEYEGQQINQQRTTLGNQSANYYNQLLGMQVPVPPSVADFTKTVYTFNDGEINNSITSMISQQNGEYSVSYTRQWTDPNAIVSATPSIVTKGTPGSYNTGFYIGATELRQIDSSITSASQLSALNGKLGFTGTPAGTDEYTGTDPRFAGKSAQECLDILKEESNYLTTQLNGIDKGNWMIKYTLNTTSGDWEPTFYQESVLTSPNTTFNPTNGNSQSTIPAYKVGASTKNDEIKNKTARFEMDATGRPINVTLNSNDPNTAVTYALTTNTVTDQNAYNDAMNQYEFNKYSYDQQVQEVNAKISITQTEDKNLELRLKQLDTEHDAVQTEMDAVSKVIQKNVESTFKTFG